MDPHMENQMDKQTENQVGLGFRFRVEGCI